MRISYGQHQTQKQVQTLAPRMIQAMEILRMAEAQLDERIEQELIENPVLEKVQADENSPSNSENETDSGIEQKELVIEEGQNNADDFERLVNLDNDIPDHFDGQRPSSNRIQEIGDRQHDLMANVVNRGETLQDFLLAQLSEYELEPNLQKMCERIISSLSAEQGGYLKTSLLDLVPPNVPPEEAEELAEEAIATVQSLEPAGVGARDLSECLLLQLNSDINHIRLVRTLISDHLEDLQYNRLPQIEKATGYTIEQIKEATEELKKLEPNPTRRFADKVVPMVTPELFLRRDENGNYVVHMEEGPVRNLHISNFYRKRLANGQATAEEKEFIKRKINAAQWLIESIEQRRGTLIKVSQAIVDHQTRFLDDGPEFKEPLKMQQIAEKIGVHVTTVSRAVDDKYIETHRGIMALRDFFVGGTTTDSGQDVAWDKIRIELKNLIDGEDKSKPYSDDEIVKRLKSKGLVVARRTVTKYRKKMGILSSRQRRDWTKK